MVKIIFALFANHIIKLLYIAKELVRNNYILIKKMEDFSTKTPIQIKFFENLKLSVPKNISIANDIAEILQISTDGAYRRMRGESILSMDELVKLCNYYKISSEIFTSLDSNSANFTFRNIMNNESGFDIYINNILTNLQKIKASDPNQIIYVAGDIPLFRQFQFPNFAAFKIAFWQKSMLNLTFTNGIKFNISSVNQKMSDLCKQISETYTQISSIEIWHDDTIVSNIKLIEYAWDSGFFESKEDALIVCKQISELLLTLEKQADKSSKFLNEEKWAENEGNFTMYQSEFQLTNNHIFVTTGNTKTIYLTHNTFNSIATTNTVFCNETEEWLKNIIRKSTLISGVGEKQRHTFFKKSSRKSFYTY